MGNSLILQTSVQVQTISGDRKYAFAKFENDICEKSLIYMKKTNFLALVKEEKLSLLQPQINLKTQFLRLIYRDREIFNGFLNNNNDINVTVTAGSGSGSWLTIYQNGNDTYNANLWCNHSWCGMTVDQR